MFMRDTRFVIEAIVECLPLANLGYVDTLDKVVESTEIGPRPALPWPIVQRIFINAEDIADVVFHWIDSDFENTVQFLK